jgi:hypothetical protein
MDQTADWSSTVVNYAQGSFHKDVVETTSSLALEDAGWFDTVYGMKRPWSANDALFPFRGESWSPNASCI